MESGVNKTDIKIKSGSLFVKGKKHGYVCNSAYCSVNSCPSVATMDLITDSSWLKTELRIYLYNCRSLINKLTEFQNFVYSSSYHVIGLTETWLDSNILDSEILPNSYTIHRHDWGARGGGVLIAVDKSVSSQLIDCPKELELYKLALNVLPESVWCIILQTAVLNISNHLLPI